MLNSTEDVIMQVENSMVGSGQYIPQYRLYRLYAWTIALFFVCLFSKKHLPEQFHCNIASLSSQKGPPEQFCFTVQVQAPS